MMAANKSNAKKEVKKDIDNEKKVKQTTKKTNNSSKNNSGSKKNQSKTVQSKNIKSEKVVDLQVLDDDIKQKLNNIESKSVNLESNDIQKLNFTLFEVILLIIITILSCILINNIITPNNSNSSASKDDIANNDSNYDDIQFFLDQYNYILENYYGEIDKEQLLKDAVNGMFSSLDDYSQVLDSTSNSFNITLQGEYEGVGIVIYSDDNGNIIINDVYDQTPAYKAGLRANDIIVKFNDISLKNISSSQLVEYISNSDEMVLTVLRDEQELEFNVKKEKVVLQSVNYKVIDKKIGYMDIDIFALNTPEQFKSALADLKTKKIKSLIIDLRDNTGGHLSAVEEILCALLDNSHIIYQTEDKNGVEKFYSKGTNDIKYPIVILQNSSSASASEIMASALSEELDAYIIGNTSFGKGTVQTLKDVGSDLQYKITSKKWLTPKGNWIHGVGIEPDLKVDLSSEYYLDPVFENDNQLQAAIEYLTK